MILADADTVKQIDAADPGKLFRELADRGDRRFFQTVVIAVDTGVDAAWHEGQGEDAEHGSASDIPEPDFGQHIGAAEDKHAGSGREQQRNRKADKQILFCTGSVFAPHFHRDKTRDRSLDTGGGHGEAERRHRGHQLIDAEPFCTNQARKEYSIEEANDSGEYAGERQKQRAGDKCGFQG